MEAPVTSFIVDYKFPTPSSVFIVSFEQFFVSRHQTSVSKNNYCQRFDYCLLQEVTFKNFLFTFYTKSLIYIFYAIIKKQALSFMLLQIVRLYRCYLTNLRYKLYKVYQLGVDDIYKETI